MYPSDEALMDSYCVGNDAAYEILYRRYEKPLLNFIYQIVFDTEVAKEIFQETFLRVALHKKRYKPRALFKTWLFKITTNLCSDRLRRQKHRSHLSLNNKIIIDDEDEVELHEMVKDDALLPDEQVERAEMRMMVRHAIASLSTEQRLVVSLKWYHGMKLKEIAEVMNCPLGTVKSHDYRANQQLRKLLAKYVKDDE
jgi:RNA polymerase sigma-70 factor (ECF subfamily)